MKYEIRTKIRTVFLVLLTCLSITGWILYLASSERTKLRTGTFALLAVLAYPAFGLAGYLITCYIARDRRAQKTLTREWRQLRTLIDNLPDYIYIKDTVGNLLLSNVSHRGALGAATEAAAVGKSDADFLPPEVAQKTAADDQAVILSGKPLKYDEVIKDFQGTEIWLSTIKMPLRDEAGRVIGLVGLSRNIEEHKQLERSLEPRVQERTSDLSRLNLVLKEQIEECRLLDNQLRIRNRELEQQYQRVIEANRHKTEFLANMSHELRTPLNCIIGFSELILDGKLGDVSAAHTEFLQDILSSGRQLMHLINGLLDLARAESGEVEFSPRPADVNGLAAEVTDTLRTEADKNRIVLELETDPLLAGAVIDSSRFKQIIYNYVSNALKFTPEEGRVTVRVRAEGDREIRLEVEDTGCGVSSEDQERLFTEFHQLDASTTKKYQGAGLGLTLTRRLVEAQGGRVGVQSEPGRGSLFFAVLPRVSQASPQSVGQSIEASAPPRTEIPVLLVLDDEPNEQAWLIQKLSTAGYAVETARTGAEALSKTNAKPFDAIILDLLLANESGWDLLSAIRAQGPNRFTPVVVMSALQREATTDYFQIDDFLTKPVKIEDLLRSLRRAGVPPGSNSIMVVDDDPGTLRLAEATLQNLGHNTVCCTNGADALRAAEKLAPCAVVLDLMMPDMDGSEFLGRFRETLRNRDIPVIIWTIKDLNADQTAELRLQAQAIAFKGTGGATSLMKELDPLLQAGGCSRAA